LLKTNQSSNEARVNGVHVKEMHGRLTEAAGGRELQSR